MRSWNDFSHSVENRSVGRHRAEGGVRRRARPGAGFGSLALQMMMGVSLFALLSGGELFAESLVREASNPIDVDPEALRAEPAPTTFSELLSGFSQSSGFEARFEEEKKLALLAAPLRSEGRLYFEAPSNLLRRVERPRAQDILVTQDQVKISNGEGEEQIIDLSSRGPARPLIESMIWIFTGDITSIEGTYHVDYRILSEEVGVDRANEQRWRVILTPKGGPLAQLVRELRVSGAGRATDSLEFVETSGDRTLTRIVDVDPQRRFDAAERLDLFGISRSAPPIVPLSEPLGAPAGPSASAPVGAP